MRGDAYLAKQDPKGAAAEYKAALNGGDAAGSGASGADAALLELKLADLGESPAAVPAIAMTPAPVPTPAAPAPNKAKP